jgi:hypothetical protein
MGKKSSTSDTLVWSGGGRREPPVRRIFHSPSFWWGVDAEVAAPDAAEFARFLAAAHLPLVPRDAFEDELRARLAPALARQQAIAAPRDRGSSTS